MGQDGNKRNSQKNFVIEFLDHNGMRPIIVLVLICGGIWITLQSNTICVISQTAPNSQSQTAPNSQSQTTSNNQNQIILRDNPVCSKYFELAALVIGGILGLTIPGSAKDSTDSTPGGATPINDLSSNNSNGGTSPDNSEKNLQPK